MMKMSFSAILLLIFSTTLFAQEDPLYPDAWHLENTGQNSYATNGGTPGFDIKAKTVIESGIKGEGVKIAVSDTGIDVDHEDLNLNFLLPGSRDFLISENDDNPPLFKGDSSGDAHGTSVTGIIAALGENNLGSKGVAPNAEFGGFNYLAPRENAQTPKIIFFSCLWPVIAQLLNTVEERKFVEVT